MNLTRNFTLHEMIKSEAALRFHMGNYPGETEVSNLRLLCENVLQPLRDYYGLPVRVNSGYRHPLVNSRVGGSPRSDHCKGMAADIEIPSIANAHVAEYIRDHLPFTQLILEFYTPGIPDSGWVHVSYNQYDLKKQVLTAMAVKGSVDYKDGLIS